jgi:hypothetical protein
MDACARYEEIGGDLAARNAGVSLGQMMGMPAIKAGGKLIGGFVAAEDAMVFKLPDAAAREQALALGGAHLFEPMAGRQMKEWVVVPLAQAGEWTRLAEQALALRTG